MKSWVKGLVVLIVGVALLLVAAFLGGDPVVKDSMRTVGMILAAFGAGYLLTAT